VAASLDAVDAIDAAAIAALADEPLDWRFKGLPAAWWGRTPAQIRTAGPRPVDDGAVGPLCVLRAEALDNNLTTMAAWCRSRGVELAPHGKTHMAPQLLSRQFDAGASAVTVATISQVRTYRAFGVRDVILANELVDASGLRWLAGQLSADPDFTFVCWVDSVAGVRQMAEALDAAAAARPVDVCVEVGMAGGRSGCRGAAAVDEVARAAAECPALRLVGVAGYEAALGHEVTGEASARVVDYLAEVRAAAERLAELFETDTVVLTAGGSTYFDAVADVLTGGSAAGRTVRTVIRSGCYLTHDSGEFVKRFERIRQRTPAVDALGPGLRPALEVWAYVQSRPEPTKALLTMGRRDVSFDQHLPQPIAWFRPGGAAALPQPVAPGHLVTELNDQHCHLTVPADSPLAYGDMVAFGISHPCTTFDKWQLLCVVDDRYDVVDAVRTYF